MEILLKAAAMLLVSSLVGLLVQKNNPELTLLLCLAAITVVFLLTSSLIETFRDFIDTVDLLTKNAAVLTRPVLKCLTIAFITQVSSALCRDASQGAASSAVELIGTVCALCVAMPLIQSILKTIGGLL